MYQVRLTEGETRHTLLAMAKPTLPLPEPIRGREPGTWACETITGRLPEIAARIPRENKLPDAAVQAIEQLIAEMPDAPIRLVDEPGVPDAADWRRAIQPYVGWNWLDPPWFFVENYFYRRVLEAIGYFRHGPTQGHDPFQQSKAQGLVASEPTIAALAERLAGWNAEGWKETVFSGLLAVALWGNQGDLSLWPADAAERPDHSNPLQATAHILADDTLAVYHHLTANSGRRVDLITDNAGYEFVADLSLVDYLLATGTAEQVVLNVKSHPYFVSDVTMPDIEKTLAFLEGSEYEAVRAFGKRLRAYETGGQLKAQKHAYWTSPRPGWEMPDDLRAELSQSVLLIFKGDANYRRLLGDLHWPYTTPFAVIVSYLPAPGLALRTLKAELASGLQAEQIERLDQEEPNWMVNGRWGVIQLSD